MSEAEYNCPPLDTLPGNVQRWIRSACTVIKHMEREYEVISDGHDIIKAGARDLLDGAPDGARTCDYCADPLLPDAPLEDDYCSEMCEEKASAEGEC